MKREFTFHASRITFHRTVPGPGASQAERHRAEAVQEPEIWLDARRVFLRLIAMSERIKRWRKVRKRKSHQYLKNPPLLFFPISLVVISLIIFCLFIYYVSTHRIKLDWLY